MKYILLMMIFLSFSVQADGTYQCKIKEFYRLTVDGAAENVRGFASPGTMFTVDKATGKITAPPSSNLVVLTDSSNTVLFPNKKIEHFVLDAAEIKTQAYKSYTLYQWDIAQGRKRKAIAYLEVQEYFKQYDFYKSENKDMSTVPFLYNISGSGTYTGECSDI